jgi:hypothetical protein
LKPNKKRTWTEKEAENDQGTEENKQGNAKITTTAERGAILENILITK